MKPREANNRTIVTTILIVVFFFLGIIVGKTDSTAGATIPAEIDHESSEQVRVDFDRFWEAWQVLDEKYPFTEPDATEKMYGAIMGLARSYDDPYTVFLPPDQTESFNEDINGEFSGVGMEVGMRNGVITVIAPLKGTPAEAAGILPGDVIYAIDDVITSDMSINSAVESIRGPRGSEVTLTILREGEFEPIDINVVRDLIEIPTIATDMVGDVFVIELYNFVGNVDQRLREAMNEFEQSGATKLILDLRNNPGGFLQSAVNTASWFLPTGEIIVQESTGEEGAESALYRSIGYSSLITRDYDMVVLVNQGSASASEIVAGALKPLEHVTLIGEQTFGKGSVQELVPLPNGTSIKITVAKWFTPDGVSISENGLEPDIEVKMTREDYEEDRDPQNETAIKHLQNL